MTRSRDPWRWLSDDELYSETDDFYTHRWLTHDWRQWGGELEPPDEYGDNWIMLQPIIRQEDLREALALLTPGELAAAAMLATGCSMGLTAELFGCSRQAIQKRIDSARRRITAQRPDIAAQYVDGRAHPKRRKPRRRF